MVSSRGARAPPVVLLDANLIYPFHLRNLLIQCGVDGLLDIRWTEPIHDEWIDSLVADGRVPRERLTRTRDIMQRVLPTAEVRGYAHRISALTLPDPRDRHVLAAAIEAGAAILLTFNLADFPAAVLTPHGVAARHPDDLLCAPYTHDERAMRATVERARASLRVSAPDFATFVETLARQRLPVFASRLRA